MQESTHTNLVVEKHEEKTGKREKRHSPDTLLAQDLYHLLRGRAQLDLVAPAPPAESVQLLTYTIPYAKPRRLDEHAALKAPTHVTEPTDQIHLLKHETTLPSETLTDSFLFPCSFRLVPYPKLIALLKINRNAKRRHVHVEARADKGKNRPMGEAVAASQGMCWSSVSRACFTPQGSLADTSA